MLESPKKYRLSVRGLALSLKQRHPRLLFVTVFLGTALATIATFYGTTALVSAARSVQTGKASLALPVWLCPADSPVACNLPGTHSVCWLLAPQFPDQTAKLASDSGHFARTLKDVSVHIKEKIATPKHKWPGTLKSAAGAQRRSTQLASGLDRPWAKRSRACTPPCCRPQYTFCHDIKRRPLSGAQCAA